MHLNKRETMDKIPLIITHADCIDGFIAAAMAKQAIGRSADIVSLTYGQRAEFLKQDTIKDRHVIIVDFSFLYDDIAPFFDQMKSLVMIDHHATAYKSWVDKELPSNVRVVLNAGSSGAKLTAMSSHLLHGAVRGGIRESYPTGSVPALVEMVSQYDLWNHEDERVLHLNAFLRAEGYPNYSEGMIEEVLRRIRNFETNDIRDEWLAMGQVAYNYEMTLIAALCKNSTFHFAGEFKSPDGAMYVPFCAMPHMFASKAGHLMNTNPSVAFTVTYSDNMVTKQREFSMRSRKEDGFEVRKIAEMLGGGGHPTAAGFTRSLDCDPYKVLEEIFDVYGKLHPQTNHPRHLGTAEGVSPATGA